MQRCLSLGAGSFAPLALDANSTPPLVRFGSPVQGRFSGGFSCDFNGVVPVCQNPRFVGRYAAREGLPCSAASSYITSHGIQAPACFTYACTAKTLAAPTDKSRELRTRVQRLEIRTEAGPSSALQ